MENQLSAQLTAISLLLGECEALNIAAPASLRRSISLLAALAESLEDELALFRSMSVSFQPEEQGRPN